VLAEVAHPRGSRSLSSHLKSRLGLGGVHMALLHERLTPDELKDPRAVAQAIGALPITLRAPRPVAEAISTAGGVRLDAVTQDLELRSRPGVFCAGEMLDWEAPTGGYLLTAALASGVRAGQGVAAAGAGGRPRVNGARTRVPARSGRGLARCGMPAHGCVRPLSGHAIKAAG
jgi:predicted flavoprotein YhiN